MKKLLYTLLTLFFLALLYYGISKTAYEIRHTDRTPAHALLDFRGVIYWK